jgi:hypothetical protein
LTGRVDFATLVTMIAFLRAYASLMSFLRRIATPLRSRKVRIALATLGVYYFRERGYALSDDFMLAVLTLSASLILGTAIEDAGAKSNGCSPHRR